MVNPGQIVKVTSGGTYAVLTIHPMKETTLRDAETFNKDGLTHSVSARTFGEIVKI